MTIWSEPRPTRKARSADALRKAADDPLVLCTVARLFWAERKIEKARQWFERAITANPDLGDNWGWWLKFERQHGVSVGFATSVAEVVLMVVETGTTRGRHQEVCEEDHFRGAYRVVYRRSRHGRLYWDQAHRRLVPC